jgi:hypothetical protein
MPVSQNTNCTPAVNNCGELVQWHNKATSDTWKYNARNNWKLLGVRQCGKHRPPTQWGEQWKKCTSDTLHSTLSVGGHLLPV